MNKRYILLAVLFILVGFGAIFMTGNILPKEVSPETLFRELNDPSRFLSTDKLAQKIIEEDPVVQLIDTRSPDQYEAFTLPGAVNIPLGELVDSTGHIQEQWLDYLQSEGMKTVFFSNGDVCADQAWVICKRLSIKNIFVLKGGLNHWVETILRPVPPETTSSEDAFELYSFRRGASLYFGGGTPEVKSSESIKTPVPVKRRKKKTAVSGGC